MFAFGGKKAEPEPEAYVPETAEERIELAISAAEEAVAAAYEVAENAAAAAAEAEEDVKLAQEAFDNAEKGPEKKEATVELNRTKKLAREASSFAKVTATRAINAAKNENRTITTSLSAADRKVYAAMATPVKDVPVPKAPEPKAPEPAAPEPVLQSRRLSRTLADKARYRRGCAFMELGKP